MKFYVASSFKNMESVQEVARRLQDRGYRQTYDWTVNQDVTTIEQLKDIGEKEKNAVMESDFIVVIIPAGKGSHVELGIALGLGKKVYLYSPNHEVNDLDTTSTFYHLSEVVKCCGGMDELVSRIVSENQ
ncbi:nucleoside 2-deoxyribosyltransferase [Paenibacillus aurantius]|uniref:Nucleoside 2-deoxyribosyltransferase n=1 Tax=Paenibacillus aurantius TaxID=2918900 RepID=A0AA96RFC8_9BACL|nr:nucleoside 2-deoxyribosyltransferase [Paenibacillus aurantius]WNQ11113.1 nucleoside 2-deoxyribosyltransferase [Paenibacillus aurantius]